jgi:hypothetical protein
MNDQCRLVDVISLRAELEGVVLSRWTAEQVGIEAFRRVFARRSLRQNIMVVLADALVDARRRDRSDLLRSLMYGVIDRSYMRDSLQGLAGRFPLLPVYITLFGEVDADTGEYGPKVSRHPMLWLIRYCLIFGELPETVPENIK